MSPTMPQYLLRLDVILIFYNNNKWVKKRENGTSNNEEVYFCRWIQRLHGIEDSIINSILTAVDCVDTEQSN